MTNENKQSVISEFLDSELIMRYRNGDDDAFCEIVTRYKNILYTFLRRFVNRQDVVEDIFQETFLQLYISQDSFDINRPLRPWLFSIAASKAKDTLRKNAAATHREHGHAGRCERCLNRRNRKYPKLL